MSSVSKAALLSVDLRHRYWLVRDWTNHGGRRMCFVMCNPSTADAEYDDPTITKCMGFARKHGFGGISVVNLYALRATDPEELWDVDAQTRIGPDNARHMEMIVDEARRKGGVVVAAWGGIRPRRTRQRLTAIAHQMRINHVLDKLRDGGDVHCLGRTVAGAPRHPLMLAYATPLERM